jgi:protease I
LKSANTWALHKSLPELGAGKLGLAVAKAESGEVQAFNHLDRGSTFAVDESLTDARAREYDGVVLPGGVANPDQLRTDERAISFLQDLFAEGKPVGVICHGPWTLVEGRHQVASVAAGARR